MPKSLSVDVARFGDDRTVIGLRQGRSFRVLAKYSGLDIMQTAERTIAFIQQERPDAVIVDGDGLGAGCVDALRHRGCEVHEFHGGQMAFDSDMYFNRRAEVWGQMKDWLAAGAQVPDDPEIEVDLCGVQYGFSSKNQIQLERKEDMKRRGMASPDLGDCLAMSFAVNVLPKPVVTGPPPKVRPWNWS